ncbi:MAG: TadE/TadG family type IV pilus assembly protein [Gammaproteobacteria bacterium]
MRGQKGVYSVEFAIVGAVFFLVLFGVIEIARALFVWNTIAEATRRGARVAAVCNPTNNTFVGQVAVFNAPGGGSASPVLNGLTTGNVSVQYLNAGGTPGAVGAAIEYVRVSITGYTHQLIIPFLPASVTNLTVPSFSTTLPAESLGYVPDTASFQCY